MINTNKQSLGDKVQRQKENNPDCILRSKNYNFSEKVFTKNQISWIGLEAAF